jgi:phosphomannomutase
MVIDPTIFRDYDIRAIIPSQLDEEGLRRITKAIAQFLKPKSVQVGRDMRVSSPQLHKACIETFRNLGINVIDLGLVSTDMLYFASGTYDEDIAITISASHNPPEYNGMKIVKKGAVAVSGDSGIYNIRDLSISKNVLGKGTKKRGNFSKRNIIKPWVEHVLKFINTKQMKSFKVVIDTGNGMAGYFLPQLEKQLPWKVTRLFYELDGKFPNHIPSPIEEKNMQDTIRIVKKENADLGMAFDGDGDRVFLVDETGKIVTGTVMTAMIAENLLQKNSKDTILYNAIVGRVVPEIVNKYGGEPHRVRVGHTLIKEAMRKYNGLFCGEHSGHYYFRDNFYADSAIIAALLVVELMSQKNKKLSELVSEYDKYPSSGEINFEVKDKETVMKNIEKHYQDKALSTDWLDGISIWFEDYWINVRPSNTEPLLRLNIEANSTILLKKHTSKHIDLIEKLGGKMKQ